MKIPSNFFRKTSSIFFTVVCVLFASSSPLHGGVITFGSGVNSFGMEFVTIGDAGNAADTTGKPNPAGAVDYEYQMGKYEVSEEMITKFNASQSLAITKDNRGPDRPATGISWNEAARFVNWLNTSQGYQSAYNFTTGGVGDSIALWDSADAWQTGGENLFRHKDAQYWLPSMDEWYKAAFYEPITDNWRQYASLDGNLPSAQANGTEDNTAVYGQGFSTGPADIDNAGGLNAYGIMGLSGNVYEWEETSKDLNNSSIFASRGVRGGDWATTVTSNLSSSDRSDFFPTMELNSIGFRVASLSSPAVIPEPDSLVIFAGLGLIGLAYRRRRQSE